MNFTIKDFFSKCHQIRRKLRIWSHLLKKSLMENFTFCAVGIVERRIFEGNCKLSFDLNTISSDYSHLLIKKGNINPFSTNVPLLYPLKREIQKWKIGSKRVKSNYDCRLSTLVFNIIKTSAIFSGLFQLPYLIDDDIKMTQSNAVSIVYQE